MEVLSPYAETPRRVIDQMLKYAQPIEGELLVDLGSGKGNIVIEAANMYPIKCVGVENDPELVKETRERIENNGIIFKHHPGCTMSNFFHILQKDFCALCMYHGYQKPIIVNPSQSF